MVISSLVIHCSPSHFAEVKEHLETMPNVEVVESRDAKLAVVLDTESTDEAVVLGEHITLMPGVIDLELVAHFFEDELE